MLGRSFSPSPADSQNTIQSHYQEVHHSIMDTSTDELMPFKRQESESGDEIGAFPCTWQGPWPKENAGWLGGWTHIHHMTGATWHLYCHSLKKATAAQQSNSQHSNSCSHQPFLSFTSRMRASSRLPAREFGTAGQRILGDSCKLGTFITCIPSKGDQY